MNSKESMKAQMTARRAIEMVRQWEKRLGRDEQLDDDIRRERTKESKQAPLR